MEHILSLSEYKNYLISLIPKLNQYKFASGSEGTVYFVDDNFVVKQYFAPVDRIIFNKYCKEVYSFVSQGLALPKIYAWTQRNGTSYILEERVKGQMLFDSNTNRIYERCKHFCTKDEFYNEVYFPKDNSELLAEIKKEYLRNYLETNINLGLMPEDNLENFIKSNYEISKKCRCSCPDIQTSNVMFDDKKLTIIDLALIEDIEGFFYNNLAENMLMRDFISLFQINNYAKEHAKYVCKNSNELKSLADENRQACFEAMRRMVKKTNSMYLPVMTNSFDYSVCESISKSVLGEKLAKEICDEIQREF